MLRSTKELRQYRIAALDGDIGHVKDVYFRDNEWVVRYVVVETGSWALNHRVLISPISIDHSNWKSRVLPVAITMAQVKDSPQPKTHRPVSRQHAMEFLMHCGYLLHWPGRAWWGAGRVPGSVVSGNAGNGRTPAQMRRYEAAERANDRNDDPHLRSCKALVGYRIRATDGDIGHVDGLLIDEETWAIRYLVVDTGKWWIGHKVVIAPEWSTGIDWAQRTVAVSTNRQSIREAPPYDASSELTREWEAGLYRHLDRSLQSRIVA